jgi:hypothetical protein
MKTIRRIFATAVLTSVFAFAALADDGIMHGDRQPTPTPTPYIPMSVNTAGDESLAAAAPSSDEPTATDIAIECALRVLGEMFLLY